MARKKAAASCHEVVKFVEPKSECADRMLLALSNYFKNDYYNDEILTTFGVAINTLIITE